MNHLEPIALFILQFLWFLFAWSLITYFVLWPRSATLSPDARLSVWVAPEMFRVPGVGLLVPNLPLVCRPSLRPRPLPPIC